ncbi:MAG TPA: hypothetical protein VGO62_16730 [Myxococcota bacterium]
MTRALLIVVATVAGIVIGFCLAVVVYRPRPDATIAAKPGDDVVAVAQLSIDDGIEHWRTRGFIELTPPVHLPTDPVESDRIAVWLNVPAEQKITVRTVNGHPQLHFPPGTTADRVETYVTDKGVVVGDVRGSTLSESGELFHVYVPAGADVTSPLLGWQWHRNDERAERAATNLLVDHLSNTRTIHDARMPKQAIVDDYQKNNACAKCHQKDKPENLADMRAIHRGTDDTGWYVPESVLQSTVPLEIHRARDMNVDDKFLSLECPSGRTPTLDENDEGSRKYVCTDGRVPVGTLDVAAGMKAHDAHVRGVCASRKYLQDHMDDAARAAFAEAFTACGL